MIIIQQTGVGSGGGGGGAVTISDTANNPIVSAGGNLQTNLFDSIGQGVLSDSGYLFTKLEPGQLTQILDAINNASNGGILNDTTFKVIAGASLTPLASLGCKSVTLIALTSNASNINYVVNSGVGDTLTLEPGYSVKVNVINADIIEVSSGSGTEELQYIVTQ